MIYDDHGGNQALDVAEAVVRAGGMVEVVTPERAVAPDVGGLVAAGYLADLARAGVRFTVLRRLRAVRRTPDGLVVTLGVDGPAIARSRCSTRSWRRRAPGP